MSFEKFFAIGMAWLLFWIAVCFAYVRLVTWLEPDEEPSTPRKRKGTKR